MREAASLERTPYVIALRRELEEAKKAAAAEHAKVREAVKSKCTLESTQRDMSSRHAAQIKCLEDDFASRATASAAEAGRAQAAAAKLQAREERAALIEAAGEELKKQLAERQQAVAKDKEVRRSRRGGARGAVREAQQCACACRLCRPAQ